MDKKYFEKQIIITYWWNYGHKIKDFDGTYKDYLKLKDIKVKPITINGVKGYQFSFDAPVRTTLKLFNSDYSQSCDEVIKVFLTLLGDKAKLIGYHCEYNINW
jgi:hypothetical protein